MSREEIIIQTDDVKVRTIELQPGEVGPFHYHTEITDNMFGIAGEIIVSLKGPTEEITLRPGVRCKIETGRVHCVRNSLEQDSSTYLLVQGVGKYDFNVENDC